MSGNGHRLRHLSIEAIILRFQRNHADGLLFAVAPIKVCFQTTSAKGAVENFLRRCESGKTEMLSLTRWDSASFAMRSKATDPIRSDSSPIQIDITILIFAFATNPSSSS